MSATIEYVLIGILYVMGVGFNISQKLSVLQKKFPSFSRKEIVQTFKKEEWNTMIVSFLGLITVQALWFAGHYENVTLPLWLHGFAVYPAAMVVGYAIQRIIYKYLGTSESALMSQQIINDNSNNINGK